MEVVSGAARPAACDPPSTHEAGFSAPGSTPEIERVAVASVLSISETPEPPGPTPPSPASPACGEGDRGGPADPQASPSARSPPRVVAKFLMCNAAAGSIIGRSGQTINELQAASGARLQLSR